MTENINTEEKEEMLRHSEEVKERADAYFKSSADFIYDNGSNPAWSKGVLPADIADEASMLYMQNRERFDETAVLARNFVLAEVLSRHAMSPTLLLSSLKESIDKEVWKIAFDRYSKTESFI